MNDGRTFWSVSVQTEFDTRISVFSASAYCFAIASKNAPLPSLFDGFSMGIGYTLALFVIGSIREILGAGTWFGMSVFGSSYKPAMLFIMPAGAFFTMAAVMALLRFAKTKAENGKHKDKTPKNNGEAVTGDVEAKEDAR